ncbi:coth protein-domain-containing protein [Powellomyces hirtus]|nr:coth protein-domain-containing protein [Powellomyces hirtus]
MRAVLLSLVAPALCGLAAAGPVTFNVLSFSTATSVLVGGVETPLKAADPTQPLFSGIVETGAATTYKYVADGVAEPFERTLNTSMSYTFNEFYNRTQTSVKLPPFPQPFQPEPIWNRDIAKLPLYDDSYVPTVHITAPAAEVETLQKTLISTVISTFTIYLKNQTVTIPGTRFAYHKDKPTYETKRGLSFAMPADKTLFGRQYFKFRDMNTDETKVRQYLHTDLARAIGLTPPRERPVRVYVNKAPYGLYAMNDFHTMDNVTNTLETWAVNHFHKGVAPEKLGLIFDAGSGSDWVYKTDDPTAYTGLKSDIPTQNVADLIPVFKQVAALGTDASDANVAALATQVDIETVLRVCALEYLTSNWDGFWKGSTNYIVYNDPVVKKWTLIPQDFDSALGMDLHNDTAASSYKDWETATLSPLINNVLKNPAQRARFETILKAIVQRLFNPVAFNRRAEPFFQQMYQDIAWDFQTPVYTVGKATYGNIENANDVFYNNATGLLAWVRQRAETVTKEFNFQWDTVIQEPPAEETETPAPAGGPTEPGTTPVGPGAPTAKNSGSRVMATSGLFAAILAAAITML